MFTSGAQITMMQILDFPTELESTRLTLRCYQPGDGAALHAASQRNRQRLQRYEADNVLMSINSTEEAERLITELQVDWTAGQGYFIGLWDRESGEWAGQVFVGRLPGALRGFEVGYVADVQREGQGLISEALRVVLAALFDHLNAHRVQLRCDETNKRSIRVADRCGFLREGHLRETTLNPDGTITGTVLYGMLRPEFERMR